MAVTPQSISVQTAYRWYRDRRIVINRRYQRKLVWTIAEKQRLIDSLLKGYPLPLLLFAELPSDSESTLEVIDGMQRLNAIFGYIENTFLLDGKCFDIAEFARARQLAEQGAFAPCPNTTPRLGADQCSNFLDYQLAVTIFPGEEPSRINDVFGRINSGGKQLSDQERRQAGVLSPFAEAVRELAAEIRGDVSRNELPLIEMPEISIQTSKNAHGYKLRAEEIFWCFQGILRTNHLRDSEDEQVIADIVASVLYEEPVKASGDFLNKIYDPNSREHSDINSLLSAFPRDQLFKKIKATFSVVREVIEASSSDRFHFRSTVYSKPTSNAQKQAFFAVFMAFYDLIEKEGKRPADAKGIMGSLSNLSDRIKIGQKHVRTSDRLSNIRVVKGLVDNFFVKADASSLGHGPGLVFDIENSIRRSRTETPRYEFKQGILRLDEKRLVDEKLLESLVCTICGIANVGPDADGYIYLVIADKPEDAKRVALLDGVSPAVFEHVQIVGVDREAKVLSKTLDKYIRIIEDFLERSVISDPLKTQVRSSLDVVTVRGFSVMRIRIPKQAGPSFVGNECYIRAGSATRRAAGPEIAAVTKLFSSSKHP